MLVREAETTESRGLLELLETAKKDLQRDLYRRMGAGFEEAYDAAVAWLSD